MTRHDPELERLYPALSALERGLLVLKAYKAGQKPDQALYNTTPSSQGAEFNRYIRLMNAVNVELATVLQILREQVEKTGLKYSWLMTLLIWGMETRLLGGRVLARTKERGERKEVRRLIARAPGNLRVPVDLAEQFEEPETFSKGYGDGLVHALLFGIHQDVRQHWCELRSVEIVVQEVAEEFGGEDPMQPNLRELLDDCLRACEKVRDDVRTYVEIELAEPTDEDVAHVQLLMEKIVEG